MKGARIPNCRSSPTVEGDLLEIVNLKVWMSFDRDPGSPQSLDEPIALSWILAQGLSKKGLK
jgi:hypothetical protein